MSYTIKRLRNEVWKSSLGIFFFFFFCTFTFVWWISFPITPHTHTHTFLHDRTLWTPELLSYKQRD